MVALDTPTDFPLISQSPRTAARPRTPHCTFSKSPKDPLNFSRARRIGVFICVVWFAIMALSIVGGFGALAPYFVGWNLLG